MSNTLDESRPTLVSEEFDNAPDGTVFGRVEILTNDAIAGWVVTKGNPNPTALTILYKERVITHTRTSVRRPDIDIITDLTELCGFYVEFDSIDASCYLDLLKGLCCRMQDKNIEITKTFANSFQYLNLAGDDRRFPSYLGKGDLRISVIIPIYDRTQELRESIYSIITQSYQNFELILVGDDPPEETRAIMHEYQSHPKVKIFVYPDRSGNACRGRNKGVAMATGHIVAFQDSDDIAAPNRLETAAHIFSNCAYGYVHLLYTDVTALTNGTREIDGITFGQAIKSRLLSFDDLKELNPIFTCSACVRRDILLLRGAFRREMTYREDHELWLRLAYYGAIFYAVPECQSLYRIHQGNAELSFIERDLHWKIKMIESYPKEWLDDWIR